MTAPSNDLIANATQLTGSNGQINGTTVGSNYLDSGEYDYHTVWYKWTAPAACQAKFTTTRSQGHPDTYMRVFQSGSQIAASGNYYGDVTSACLWFAEAGVEYYISVGAEYFGTTDIPQYSFDFVLDWQSIAIQPAETLSNTPPANSTFAGAIQINGIFGEITDDVNGSPDQSLWYVWTPDAPGSITFTMTPLNNGQVAGVEAYRGDSYASSYSLDPNPNLYGYDIDVATFPAVVGVPLHINASMYDATRGKFRLSWNQTQPQVDPNSNMTFTALMTTQNSAYRIISNPLVNEVWVEQDIYEPTTPRNAQGGFNAIARFREGDNAFLGYISLPEAPYDPIFYDSFNQRVWIPLKNYRTTYVSALPPFTQGPVFNFLMQYGDAISPVDGTLWLMYPRGPATSTVSGVYTLEQWNQNTGTMMHSFRQDGITDHIFELQFTKDGRLFGNYQAYSGDPNAFRSDLYADYNQWMYEFNTTTGLATQLQPVVPHVDRFVISEKRNSLFLLTFLPDPATGLTDPNHKGLVEYSLTTNQVVASYVLPHYYDQFSYYYYIVADDLRNAIWVMDQGTGQISEISQATGAVMRDGITPNGGGNLTVSPSGIWVMPYDVFYKITVDDDKLGGIINDRDVWLESFATRYENATVQNATVTSNAQNAATGVSVLGAKRLTLNATSQTFIMRDGL